MQICLCFLRKFLKSQVENEMQENRYKSLLQNSSVFDKNGCIFCKEKDKYTWKIVHSCIHFKATIFLPWKSDAMDIEKLREFQ